VGGLRPSFSRGEREDCLRIVILPRGLGARELDAEVGVEEVRVGRGREVDFEGSFWLGVEVERGLVVDVEVEGEVVVVDGGCLIRSIRMVDLVIWIPFLRGFMKSIFALNHFLCDLLSGKFVRRELRGCMFVVRFGYGRSGRGGSLHMGCMQYGCAALRMFVSENAM